MVDGISNKIIMGDQAVVDLDQIKLGKYERYNIIFRIM